MTKEINIENISLAGIRLISRTLEALSNDQPNRHLFYAKVVYNQGEYMIKDKFGNLYRVKENNNGNLLERVI